MGQFEQGWPGYELRWKCKEFGTLPPFQAHLWDGSPLDGRTILVHAEQGLGDTLQFIRYIPLMHERGGRVIMMCQPPLVRLLARCPGIERLMPHGDAPPEIDLHVPMLSLPRLLGTTLESVLADGPYLDAEPDLVKAWRHRLGGYPGLNIGIAWQGNPKVRPADCGLRHPDPRRTERRSRSGRGLVDRPQRWACPSRLVRHYSGR
jgi:hypothetical protein